MGIPCAYMPNIYVFADGNEYAISPIGPQSLDYDGSCVVRIAKSDWIEMFGAGVTQGRLKFGYGTNELEFCELISTATAEVKFVISYEQNQSVTATFSDLLHNPLVATNNNSTQATVTYTFSHATFRSATFNAIGSVTLLPGGNIDKTVKILAPNYNTTIAYGGTASSTSKLFEHSMSFERNNEMLEYVGTTTDRHAYCQMRRRTTGLDCYCHVYIDDSMLNMMY